MCPCITPSRTLLQVRDALFLGRSPGGYRDGFGYGDWPGGYWNGQTLAHGSFCNINISTISVPGWRRVQRRHPDRSRGRKVRCSPLGRLVARDSANHLGMILH